MNEFQPDPISRPNNHHQAFTISVTFSAVNFRRGQFTRIQGCPGKFQTWRKSTKGHEKDRTEGFFILFPFLEIETLFPFAFFLSFSLLFHPFLFLSYYLSPLFLCALFLERDDFEVCKREKKQKGRRRRRSSRRFGKRIPNGDQRRERVKSSLLSLSPKRERERDSVPGINRGGINLGHKRGRIVCCSFVLVSLFVLRSSR